MENRSFRITDHAYRRMESRNITHGKLAEIMGCGQVFSGGRGLYRAKLYQRAGKSEICYEAVFSKQNRTIISVWENVKPLAPSDHEENGKVYTRTKIYKQRKRALREQEFNSWCREEYGSYNLSFPA